MQETGFLIHTLLSLLDPSRRLGFQLMVRGALLGLPNAQITPVLAKHPLLTKLKLLPFLWVWSGRARVYEMGKFFANYSSLFDGDLTIIEIASWTCQ